MHRAEGAPRTTTHGCKRRDQQVWTHVLRHQHTYTSSMRCDRSRVSHPSRPGLHLSDCHGDCFKVLLCFSSSSEEDNSTWSYTAEKKATKHSGKGSELWLKGVCVQSDALYIVVEGYRDKSEQPSNYSDTITAFYSCIVSNNRAFKINTGCVFSRITHFSFPLLPWSWDAGVF